MEKRIVGAMLLLVAMVGWSYEPPSDDEISGYWETLTRAERILEIRKLNEIEHAVPNVVNPSMVVTQTDDGVIYAYPSGLLMIDIAGHLQYTIELPSVEVQGIKRIDPWPYFWGGVAGGVVVVVAVTLFLVLR